MPCPPEPKLCPAYSTRAVRRTPMFRFLHGQELEAAAVGQVNGGRDDEGVGTVVFLGMGAELAEQYPAVVAEWVDEAFDSIETALGHRERLRAHRRGLSLDAIAESRRQCTRSCLYRVGPSRPPRCCLTTSTDRPAGAVGAR